LALPKALWNPRFLDPFFLGLRAMGEAFGAALAGGDISSSPKSLCIDITAVGEVEKGRALLRSRARPGDDLYCTGSLGDSAAGLALELKPGRARSLPAGYRRWLLKRHHAPLPRVLAGRFLVEKRLSRCAIDISDGLASEARHLAAESRVAIELDADAIPLSPALRAAAKAWRKSALGFALRGGEDYELLFSAPPASRARLTRDFSRLSGSRLYRIGKVKRGRGVSLLQGGRLRPLQQVGFDHFQ
jgi:thiamine-monophosphate kinase